MTNLGAPRPRNTLGKQTVVSPSRTSRKLRHLEAQSHAPSHRRGGGSFSPSKQRDVRSVSVELVDELQNDPQGDPHPRKRRRIHHAMESPTRTAKNGSMTEEDELIYDVPSIKTTSPAPRHAAHSRSDIYHEGLPGVGSSSFYSLEEMVSSNGYPDWRQADLAGMRDALPGSRDPGYPQDLVQTTSLNLPNGKLGTALKQADLRKQETRSLDIPHDQPTRDNPRRQTANGLGSQPATHRSQGALGSALNPSQQRSSFQKIGEANIWCMNGPHFEDQELLIDPRGKFVRIQDRSHSCSYVIDLEKVFQIDLQEFDGSMVYIKLRGGHEEQSRISNMLIQCKDQYSFEKLRERLKSVPRLRMISRNKTWFQGLIKQHSLPSLSQPASHQHQGLLAHENYDVDVARAGQQKRKPTENLEEGSYKKQRMSPPKLSRGLRGANGVRPDTHSVQDDRPPDLDRVAAKPPASCAGADYAVFAPRRGVSSRTRRASNRDAVLLDHSNEDTKLEQPAVPYSKSHGLGIPWKRPLTYPRTGKHKSTIYFEDLLRLDEGECLNDNLIQFYLRYLQDRMEQKTPGTAKKVYWFNSYFYATLTSGIPGKKVINFDAVKRWTRTVDLFQYDYVVVPINESAHWYLVVLCNLPAMLRSGPPENVEQEERNEVNLIEVPEQPTQVSDRTDVDKNIRNFESTTDAELVEIPASDSVREVDNPKKASTNGVQIENRPNALQVARSPTPAVPASAEMATASHTLQDSQQTVAESITESQDRSEGSLILLERDVEQFQPARRVPDKKRRPPVRQYNPREPAIITLDSLGQTHPNAHRALKRYLVEEALDKKGYELEESSIKGLNARGIPQQQNFCDCGLFLLGYMEKFADDPQSFVTKLLRKEFSEIDDWPELRPSAMRSSMRELLFRMHKEDSESKANTPTRRKPLPRLSDTLIPPKHNGAAVTTTSNQHPCLQTQDPSIALNSSKCNGTIEATPGHSEQGAHNKEAMWSAKPGGNSNNTVNAVSGEEMILDSQEQQDRLTALAQQADTTSAREQAGSHDLMAQLQHAADVQVVDLEGGA